MVPGSPGAVSDGYLVAGNGYDGKMYVFGKGQSATTLSAPQTAATVGQKLVLIRNSSRSVTSTTRNSMRFKRLNDNMDAIPTHAATANRSMG